MTTEVKENDFGFTVKTGRAGQVEVTNSTSRDWSNRELVAVADANDKYLIGFVAEIDGIAAGESGQIDMFPEQSVTTNQLTAASFVAKDITVYVTPQTDLAGALITEASSAGSVPLDALIVAYDSSNEYITLRMPVQNGTADAAVDGDPSNQIDVTNTTARDWAEGELVAVADANDKYFIGFVVDADGIDKTDGTGKIELYPGQEVTTDQLTVASFTEGDVSVYVTPQTDLVSALVTKASASGDVQLDALIVEYDSSGGTITLRMPYQNGTATAA